MSEACEHEWRFSNSLNVFFCPKCYATWDDQTEEEQHGSQR